MLTRRESILSELFVLYLVFLTVVVVTIVTNLIQVYKESAEIKQAGQSPLIARNITTVVMAGLGELLTVTLVVYLFSLTSFTTTITGVIVVYLVGQALRNLGAYLVAWGTWSTFLYFDKRKMQNQIEKDKEEAL